MSENEKHTCLWCKGPQPEGDPYGPFCGDACWDKFIDAEASE